MLMLPHIQVRCGLPRHGVAGKPPESAVHALWCSSFSLSAHSSALSSALLSDPVSADFCWVDRADRADLTAAHEYSSVVRCVPSLMFVRPRIPHAHRSRSTLLPYEDLGNVNGVRFSEVPGGSLCLSVCCGPVACSAVRAMCGAAGGAT